MLEITIINGKPAIVKNNFTIGTFDSQAQAEQAARQIAPLLTGDAKALPKILEVIREVKEGEHG